MISYNFQKKLESILQPKLAEYFATKDAKKLLAGKESGHIMGTIVETMCGEFLQQEGFTITHELDSNGNRLKRAHSDFLLLSNDLQRNKTNVKFGSENPGQPNVCSINRMMDALRDGTIDGYYLLKVKFNRKEKTTKVYFVDVLHYIDCITCDGGTGQIMLKEKKFYEVYGENGREDKMSSVEKTYKIYELFDKQMGAHIKRKQKQQQKRRLEIIELMK